MSLREPKRFGGKTTLAIAIAGLSLGMTSPALHAQQDDEALTLEVVRVVAQKREESVFEVPAAVTAISAEMLANSGINDFSGLTSLAPSLTIQDAANTGNASINLRGIGTYAFSIGVEHMALVCPERLWACKKGSEQMKRHKPSRFINLDWREDYLNKGGTPDRALAVSIWDTPNSSNTTYELWSSLSS